MRLLVRLPLRLDEPHVVFARLALVGHLRGRLAQDVSQLLDVLVSAVRLFYGFAGFRRHRIRYFELVCFVMRPCSTVKFLQRLYLRFLEILDRRFFLQGRL